MYRTVKQYCKDKGLIFNNRDFRTTGQIASIISGYILAPRKSVLEGKKKVRKFSDSILELSTNMIRYMKPYVKKPKIVRRNNNADSLDSA